LAGSTPARLCAYRAVRQVFGEGARADRAFRVEAERGMLEGRERALAQRLAYGTIQRRGTLDYVLAACSDRPLDRVDGPLLDALRLGVFQLLYLDAVPERAAVDETVELAKLSDRHAHGFVNAVMRRAAREARGLVAQLNGNDPEDAAVLYSHPRWLVQLWWEALGASEARALLEADNQPRELVVRANTLVTTQDELKAELLREGVPAHPAQNAPDGLVLDAPFDAHGSALFRDGALMPQSRGSMLVAQLLDPEPGERVLDLCAAPGAKATHIAALMGGEGEIVAVDRDPRRAEELRENCERMKARRVEVVETDAAEPVDRGLFDRVLLDPPCSALGTLRSRADARWRQSPDRIEALAQVQEAMLRAALDQVRPGGVVVYSTCTISPRENEDVVNAVAASRDDVEVDHLGSDLAHPSDPRFILTLPHRHGTDGFLMARLRRLEA
jgi:16S rRNA (cytosine967-C5)-methyltransferase